MIVTTIFNQELERAETLRLHTSYWESGKKYFSADNFYYDKESEDHKKVVKAYVWEDGEMYEDYFLKKDCKRLHRSGNKYIFNLSLDKAEKIEYNGKTYYFTSEKARFDAGFVFDIASQEWIDLKVEERHLWGSLVLIRKPQEHFKYVVSTRNPIFQELSKDLTYSNVSSTYMASVPTHRLAIYYHYTCTEQVIFCAIKNRWETSNDYKKFKIQDGDEIYEIAVSRNGLYNLSRNEFYTIYLKSGYNFVAKYQSTNWQGTTYFNTATASMYGYEETICPHCNNSVDSSHNMDRCERDNHRNPRFSYHESGIEAKTIQIDSKVVFRIGVEIEKQSFLGSKHNNREILNQFGWKKERDGSLCDRIGYELVSPCYPLFTDELINEVKEMERTFPSLINGNDLKHTDKTKDACGGHIHFSRSYTRAEDLFEMISGYMPLLYAIYKKRSEAYYSIAKEKHAMKNSSDKMQAVKIIRDGGISDRIEFRIFPLVDSVDTLQWRINLLRVMANNPTNRAHEVINMLADKDSDLYKLFAEIFTAEKIKKRATDAIALAKRFDSDYRNYDFTLVENRIAQLV